MKGIDVSHYQKKINWKDVKKDGVEFAIMKATEATGFVDSRLKENKQGARDADILCGYYHFARGGDVKKEADHFLNTVGDINKGELLVLDWEINHVNPVGWCLEWLKYVEEKVGFKPLIYLNLYIIRNFDWSSVVKNDNGLWVARYGDNDQDPENWEVPDSYEWPFWAIWQYSSKGRVRGISGNVDLNLTSMNLETLKKYGKQEDPIVCLHCCPIHCN